MTSYHDIKNQVDLMWSPLYSEWVAFCKDEPSECWMHPSPWEAMKGLLDGLVNE